MADVAEQSGEFLQIVNYNLRGSQYAIAGTVAGLEALEAVVEERRERRAASRRSSWCPASTCPSTPPSCTPGSPTSARGSTTCCPRRSTRSVLIGRYIPNLVPRLFTLDRSYVEEVAAYVDSPLLAPVLEDWDAWEADPARLGRTLLIELLAWQFASPVRWIETQDLLFGRARPTAASGMEQFVEVGVANAPTLANLAAQTTEAASYDGIAPGDRELLTATPPSSSPPTPRWSTTSPRTSRLRPPGAARRPPSVQSPAVDTKPAAPAPPRPRPAPSAPPTCPSPPPTRPAPWPRLRTKVRPDQIGAGRHDRGALRRRLLAPQPAAGRPRCRALASGAIDGAAEADWSALAATVTKLARTYSRVRPGADRGRAGAAAQVRRRRRREARRDHRPGQGHLAARPRLGHPRAGRARRRRSATAPATRGGALGYELGPRATSPPSSTTPSRRWPRRRASRSTMPATGGGEGAIVDAAALGEITAVDHRSRRRARLDRPAPARQARAGRRRRARATTRLDRELVQLVESELGSDWARKVAPTFDERRAVLLDDRWASVREDFARVWVGDDEVRRHSLRQPRRRRQGAGRLVAGPRPREKRTDLVAFYEASSPARQPARLERRRRRRHRRRSRLDRRCRRRRPAARRGDRRRDHLAARPGAARASSASSTATTPRPAPPSGCCRPTWRRTPTSTRWSSGSANPVVEEAGGQKTELRPGAGPDAGLPVRRSRGAGHGGRRRPARRGRVPRPAVGRRAPGHRPGGPGRRPPDRPPRARRPPRLAQPRPLRRRRRVRRGQGRASTRSSPALAGRAGVGAAGLPRARPHRLGRAAPA